jgi:hypothetical protein
MTSPQGSLRAQGTVNVAGYSPTYEFSASVNGFAWRGGLLNAEGTFATTETGSEAVRNLRGSGRFWGEDLNVSPDDAFSKVSGLFDISFAAGWPDLRLSNIQVSEDQEAWSGEAATQSDGKLVFELEHEGRQRRVISALQPEAPAVSSAIKGSTEDR